MTSSHHALVRSELNANFPADGHVIRFTYRVPQSSELFTPFHMQFVIMAKYSSVPIVFSSLRGPCIILTSSTDRTAQDMRVVWGHWDQLFFLSDGLYPVFCQRP